MAEGGGRRAESQKLKQLRIAGPPRSALHSPPVGQVCATEDLHCAVDGCARGVHDAHPRVSPIEGMREERVGGAVIHVRTHYLLGLVSDQIGEYR